MKRKEITKTFMMTSNGKKTLVSMAVYTKIFPRCEVKPLLRGPQCFFVGPRRSGKLIWAVCAGGWAAASEPLCINLHASGPHLHSANSCNVKGQPDPFVCGDKLELPFRELG